MALVIRLRQVGKKNQQSYRMVVTDKRFPRDGKYIAMVGWYNPFASQGKTTFVEADKIRYWLDKGAKLSENVTALLKNISPDIVNDLYEKKIKKAANLKGKKTKKALPKAKEAKPAAEKTVKKTTRKKTVKE